MQDLNVILEAELLDCVSKSPLVRAPDLVLDLT
jgi:hypothetical protein